jgi:hypothetical protein
VGKYLKPWFSIQIYLYNRSTSSEQYQSVVEVVAILLHAFGKEYVRMLGKSASVPTKCKIKMGVTREHGDEVPGSSALQLRSNRKYF